MTIHASKGLEFPAVFVIGVNDGLLPHQKSMTTPEGFEEERRLFYVAVTRAERLLHISYTSSRAASGSVYSTHRSVFLDDLPPEHVVYESRKQEFSGRDSRSYSDLPSKERAYEPEDAARKLRPGQRVTHDIFRSWGC